MSIKTRIEYLKSNLPLDVNLVAVSKTKSTADIMEAYKAGQRIFGENKVQELVFKREQLPKDIIWHMIGHLQTNKVKYIASFIGLIHSIDSIKLMEEINRQGQKNNRQIKGLLQVNISQEETKFGLHPKDVEPLLRIPLPYINIVGLMGMANFTTNINEIKKEFNELKKLLETLKSKYVNLSILSMGMSSDYLHAIDSGSNMIRLGSTIFGKRG